MIIAIKVETKDEKHPENYKAGLFLQMRWTAPNGERMDIHELIPGIADKTMVEQKDTALAWVSDKIQMQQQLKTLKFN